MKRLMFLIIFVSNYIYSQTEKRSSYDVKSPNVSDFIRYGNIPVKMYTGELDFNFNFLKQGDIDLSLSYNASGFVPNKRSGIVGLNWNINGIGMITRDVKGVPDDHIGAPNTLNGINGRFAHGFMVGMKYMKDAGAALPNGQLTSAHPQEITMLSNTFDIRFNDATGGNTNAFETTPDIFQFNVNGLSGKFFMTSDGKIKVISNSPNVITVDISNFNFQPYTVFCSPINFSEFKIIDDKGNKYYFGGESRYLEYSLSYNKSDQFHDGSATNPIINTWFLKRVEYYNGDITNYNYQDDEINGDSFFCNNPVNWFKSPRNTSHYKRLFFMTESVNDSRELINSASSSSGGAGNIYTLHKKAFLENVIGNNFSIYFTYTEQGFIFNNNPNLVSSFKKIDEFKLSNVKLQYGSQVIKNIDFQYLIKGGTTTEGSYPRLFLDKVQETGKPPYQFEYDVLPTQVLPVPSTCAVDFWGFYNGKNSNNAPPYGYAQLIPQSNVDANGDQTFVSDIRNSNFNFAKVGMLKKVIYPTGGYSEFEYEPHEYAKRLDRKSSGSFLPNLYDVTGQVGGVRIKKISDFDGTQSTNIKEYLYTTAAGVSSGILMQWPRTQLVFIYQSYIPSCFLQGVYYSDSTTNGALATIQSSTINMNSLENSVMTYSRVTEKTTNNGYKIYNFKDYINYPDNSDFTDFQKVNKIGNLCGDYAQEIYSPENLAKNIYVLFNDRSQERGKIESVLVYDVNNNLSLKEEYFYNTDPNRFNLNSKFAAKSNFWWYQSKQYYYSDFLTEKKITEYNAAGTIVTTQKSNYISAPSYSALMSNQDVLSKSINYTSVSNEILETEFKYPWQIYLSTSTNYLSFQTSHIITPLREIQSRNSSKLSESFTLYSKDATTNNLLLPKNIYSAKFPNNFPLLTDIGQLEKKVTYDFYDVKGNPIQLTYESGMAVAIIWGYSKTLPIAKIENATLAQVASALGITTTSLQSYNESNITAINGLRALLPNAMITTYIHKPLVGVESITDPKGDVSNFIYDSNGRLKNVKDKNNNLLTEYQYHYKNQ